MQVIIAYHMVAGTNAAEFNAEVVRLLDEGWQPLGGIAVGQDGKFYQAMVKYGEHEQLPIPNPIYTARR